MISGLFGTAPAPAPPLLELELSQTVSAPPKLGVELGGALTKCTRVVELGLGSSTTPLQTQLLELYIGVGAVPNRPIVSVIVCLVPYSTGIKHAKKEQCGIGNVAAENALPRCSVKEHITGEVEGTRRRRDPCPPRSVTREHVIGRCCRMGAHLRRA
ncbi:hypothetical protein OsI_11366 [Oryza sativa Indica Group]|uniref:Uncharacterized protein n=1 Tax=Oryza sativa subsp. indica TaxID=39946 RepID=A2XG59_ORYSI|nr:hypothetical protein OsI_11366 [Oryza sativa Indica Group]